MMDAADFLKELSRLEEEHLSARGSTQGFQCTDCERCISCLFSRDCQGCYKCTHCQSCQGCTNCSHSTSCRECHECAFCIECAGCTRSAYLVKCTSCFDCTFCYGCVGLAKRDFHILNEPYPREEYFKIIERLSPALGVSSKR